MSNVAEGMEIELHIIHTIHIIVIYLWQHKHPATPGHQAWQQKGAQLF